MLQGNRRIFEKAKLHGYDNCFDRITDYIRGMFTVPSVADMVVVLQELRDSPWYEILRVKNRCGGTEKLKHPVHVAVVAVTANCCET